MIHQVLHSLFLLLFTRGATSTRYSVFSFSLLLCKLCFQLCFLGLKGFTNQMTIHVCTKFLSSIDSSKINFRLQYYFYTSTNISLRSWNKSSVIFTLFSAFLIQKGHQHWASYFLFFSAPLMNHLSSAPVLFALRSPPV